MHLLNISKLSTYLNEKKSSQEMKFAYILFEMHASVLWWPDACPSVPYSAPLHDTYENQHIINNQNN